MIKFLVMFFFCGTGVMVLWETLLTKLLIEDLEEIDPALASSLRPRGIASNVVWVYPGRLADIVRNADQLPLDVRKRVLTFRARRRRLRIGAVIQALAAMVLFFISAKIEQQHHRDRSPARPIRERSGIELIPEVSTILGMKALPPPRTRSEQE